MVFQKKLHILLIVFSILFFTGTKTFVLWICVVVTIIYVLDTFVLTQERVAQFVYGEKGECLDIINYT